MGKYNNGIMGPFSGKVGTVVGSYWKGRFVMRQRPHYQGSRTYTTNQLLQQSKFSASTSFAKIVSGMLNIGYLKQAKNNAVAARNIAVSRLIENSLQISGTGATVDPSKVQMSEGLNANTALTVAQSGTTLNISWTNNAGILLGYLSDGTQMTANDNDYVYIGVYNSNKKRFIMNTNGQRGDEAAIVSIADLGWEAGDHLCIYNFIVEEKVKKMVTGSVMSEIERKKAEMIFNEGYGVSDTAYTTITMS